MSAGHGHLCYYLFVTTMWSGRAPHLGVESCKIEILTPKDPFFISGDKVRGVKLRNSGRWSRKAAALRTSLQ